ncbi:unnamed protein product (macronuclear) [Paramecium tetraurelia]|uniref:Uncharacterized protein n=1 Tax=Paramecium tetraurelia TaxID=5888 RepID=A0DQL1_PARTE|nr:uncharacterized protein GSPATT00002728001 [Paramecium tetraurelia]CAK85328.1 unnamed protein product [Paramecium tetraurelia]|eukprot:XP_001452725.1 hypothetical protein (macronuclear) [Paramecium tetraurelia strain d4-2]
MENFQNITKIQGTNYQLFVRKAQVRQINDIQRGYPIYGCKMNIQQSPRMNYPIKFKISFDKQQKTKSNSVNHEQNHTIGQLTNGCHIYQQYINEIINKKKNTTLSTIEQSIIQNKQNKQDTQFQQDRSFIMPKLVQQRKYKRKILQKQIVTECSLIDDLKPWESYHNSLALFQ